MKAIIKTKYYLLYIVMVTTADPLTLTSPNFKFIEFMEFNHNYGKTRMFHQ